jgi:adenylylsulfate kinase-like enzyme
VARNILGPERFIEVYLAADLSVCERRDPRGLYGRARAGEIAGFTGISAPYEAPENPTMRIDTGLQSVEQSIAQLLDAVLPRLRTGHTAR